MVYEWIHLKGVGAMHSSTGIVVTIQEMLDVVPAEVLRYLIIRNKPEKHIEFDPALPLLSLVDEYDQRKGDKRAIELSNINGSGPFEIPFRHMVTAVQIARGDEENLFVALQRSGYDVITRREEILGRARNVQTWLDKYAPAYVKFQVQETLPSAVKNLTSEKRRAWASWPSRWRRRRLPRFMNWSMPWPRIRVWTPRSSSRPSTWHSWASARAPKWAGFWPAWREIS